MSFSTLKCYKMTRYDSKAFPRVSEIQKKLATCMEPIASNIDAIDDHLTWTTRPEDPTLIFYVPANFTTIDNNEFAVKLPGEIRNAVDMPNAFEPTEPFVVVCILRSNKEGSLTDEDKQVLKKIRDLPDKYKKGCLFVSDAKSITNERLSYLSEMIGLELKTESKFNEIFHRLFQYHSTEIPIRLSLYLEKQILNRIKNDARTIQQKLDDTGSLENILNASDYHAKYEATLRVYPLNSDSCKQFLREASLRYPLKGDTFTRNKWKVDEVKEKIARFICKEILQIIGQILIDRFQSDLKAKDLKFADDLFKCVDVTDIQRELYRIFFVAIFAFIWDGVKAFVTVFATLFVGESLDSIPFRNKVADTVCSQIMEHSREIMSEVLETFKKTQLKRFKEIKDKLMRNKDALSKVNYVQLESQNMTDCFYHELKVVAKRHPFIRAISCEQDEFSVFITYRKNEEVSKFLGMYLKDEMRIKICEFKNYSIRKFVYMQSGDKVIRGEQNNKYGTVGIVLKTPQHYFGTTCSHVVDNLREDQVKISFEDGEFVYSDQIITPSESLEFSVIRINQTARPVYLKWGIRNKNGCYVNGTLLEMDTITLKFGTQVYKWGASSRMTTGIYKGTYEDLEMSFVLHKIVNDNSYVPFAIPGDSGSLVCFSGLQNEVAAFMVIGEFQLRDSEEPSCIACLRVADGLFLTEKEIPDIKHCLSVSYI